MRALWALIFGMLAAWCGCSTGAGLPAQACGIGQPATMYLDATPAMAFPTGSASAAHPLGIFADDAVVGQRVTFSENVAGLPGFDPTAYRWLWSFGDGTTATGLTVAHVYTQSGHEVVRLSLIGLDASHQSVVSFDSSQLTIMARALADPPVVHAAASMTVTGIGDAVIYTGAGSYAPVGGAVQWHWNFGDGAVAQGAQVTHRFFQLGSGSVVLTVIDRRDAQTSIFLPIKIVPELPQPRFVIAPSPLHANQAIRFDAATSRVPPTPGNAVADYLWDFGDGTHYESQDAIATHTYRTAGSFHVTLTITDMSGLPATTTQTITIVAAPATVAPSVPAWIWIGASMLLLAGMIVRGRKRLYAFTVAILRPKSRRRRAGDASNASP